MPYIFGLRIIDCMDNYGSCIYCFVLRPWNFVLGNKLSESSTKFEDFAFRYLTLCAWYIWLTVLRETEHDDHLQFLKIDNFTMTQIITQKQLICSFITQQCLCLRAISCIKQSKLNICMYTAFVKAKHKFSLHILT